MSDIELGDIEIIGDEAEVRLVRTFDRPPQMVWGALTRSSRLVEWLAPGTVTQALGGAVKLDFADSGIVIDSRVTAFVPGRLLEYSWSGPGEPLRPVRWEIEAVSCGTRLTLTLTLPACEALARSCAGWEAHLEMLAAALQGVPIKFPFAQFKASREAYKARMGVAA